MTAHEAPKVRRKIGSKETTPQAEVDKFWMRKFNITSFLFDRQLAFVEDPAPFKVAVCSRRAGKTVACAAHLIHTSINNPGVLCLYITLSSKNAKRIIWKDLKKINRDFNLGGVTNEVELTVTFQNGSVVYIAGANDRAAIEDFRGLPIKLCYIDECQSFPDYIEDLIDDVIGPGLIDYAGSLCLIGTPGPVPTGYFHSCAVVNEIWSKHSWTFWDNPHIPKMSGMTHQALFDRELRRRGTTPEHPSMQREWFGKWVLDSDSLLVKYDAVKNNFDTLDPKRIYHYIMGIDVGFNDADAICILAYSDHEATTYLVDELITTKQGVEELANQIKELDKKYKVTKMVMDMGALGKKIGEEIIRRYHIPVEAADKTRKFENIEIMNDALRAGRLRAKPTSRFAKDSYLVEVDRSKTKPDKLVVSDRYHSDIIDSVLYAFKNSPAFAYTKPKEKPKPGTKEYHDQEVDDMWNRELQGYLDEEAAKKEYLGE